MKQPPSHIGVMAQWTNEDGDVLSGFVTKREEREDAWYFLKFYQLEDRTRVRLEFKALPLDKTKTQPARISVKEIIVFPRMEKQQMEQMNNYILPRLKRAQARALQLRLKRIGPPQFPEIPKPLLESYFFQLVGGTVRSEAQWLALIEHDVGTGKIDELLAEKMTELGQGFMREFFERQHHVVKRPPGTKQKAAIAWLFHNWPKLASDPKMTARKAYERFVREDGKPDHFSLSAFQALLKRMGVAFRPPSGG